MFAVIANVIAFYVGAGLLERSGNSLLGLAAYMAAALAGTLAATLLDACVRSLRVPSRRGCAEDDAECPGGPESGWRLLDEPATSPFPSRIGGEE